MNPPFFCRARAFFAAHGIRRLHRVVTDNGANYRAKDFTRCVEALAGRHQRIKPYTPRHNGKVERYNRLLADEVLYVRPLCQRAGPPGRDRGVGEPLQLPSAPYRLWRSSPGLTRPGPCQ